MAYAVLLHALLIGAGLGFALLQGLFPRESWGGARDGGAIAVQLVSSALPLPADKPPNDQVLATEKPSEAPAPPAPKAQATVDASALAIAAKTAEKKKQAEKKQLESKPLKPAQTQTAANPSPHTLPNPRQDNKAAYGEQAAGAVQRTLQPTATSANGQTSVTAGARGFNYPYYVENIQRRVFQNTQMGEVDPRTPHGTRTYILFTVKRDGSPADVKLDKASGSSTLDQACLRAARRVDTFGPLPSPPGDGNLTVSYYCDY